MAFRRSTGLRNKILGNHQNILSNPTFESGTSGWSGSNATLTSVSGGQSGNALQITNSTTASGIAYQDITTKVGRDYKLDCYVKAGTSNITVKIGTPTNPSKVYTSQEITDDSTWTHIEYLFTSNDDTIRISFEASSTASGDNMYVDEVNLYDKASSVQEVFKNSKIKIYTGTQPASADDAPTGTMLVEITVNGDGTGLTFDDAVNGILKKNASEIWSGTAVATGTAGWFRLQSYGDPESLSETAERIDGAIATSGAELNMSNTSIEAQAVQTISLFQITIDG